ncbi:NAD(P)H-quinone oxidoreductase [Olivibacter ginsenosidimutans]|uniref:NAD(P)H-quinone oxidoreductase n=1 Tax=Olivibacter ginsenosidimutans TaxID=1176537 RepID=A0ABP9B0I0_9SPHI
MKAIVISEYGAPDVLTFQDRPIPEIAVDEVLIEVKAAGVNRPDILQRKGNYPAPKDAPTDIPGLEVAGLVKEVGKQVHNWQVGDSVCALVAGGGYATHVVAKADHCLPIPEKFTFIQAASLPETIFTVWSNVFRRGNLQANEKLLIHGGSSGIGITAIQLAKKMGATVYATAGSDEKCEACMKLGADICINYKRFDFEKVFAKEGLDVILDMVGGIYFEKNIQILKEEGRLIYINAMQGALVQLNLLKMMRKRITITGSTLRDRDKNFKAALTRNILQHVWPILESGEFKPIIYKTFPLRKAALAHELMESNQHVGKIILKV